MPVDAARLTAPPAGSCFSKGRAFLPTIFPVDLAGTFNLPVRAWVVAREADAATSPAPALFGAGRAATGDFLEVLMPRSISPIHSKYSKFTKSRKGPELW